MLSLQVVEWRDIRPHRSTGGHRRRELKCGPGGRLGNPRSRSAARWAKTRGRSFVLLAIQGGIVRPPRHRAARALTTTEREQISRGVAVAQAIRAIARELGRPASTISREVARNGGRTQYRAVRAEARMWRTTARPKRCRLARAPRLCALVTAKLQRDWSPAQIAGWLKRTYPRNPAMHVSHETIYRTLYVQARGALKKELLEHLRRSHAVCRSWRLLDPPAIAGPDPRRRPDRGAAGERGGSGGARALGGVPLGRGRPGGATSRRWSSGSRASSSSSRSPSGMRRRSPAHSRGTCSACRRGSRRR